MQRITNIKTHGLKGVSHDIELQPVTIITGGNFTGKSTLRLALELLLLRYSPSHGKTNQAIFEMASGKEINLALEVDGKLATACRWVQNDKGGVKSDHGEEWPVPPVMLDLASVFDMPKAKRFAYLFEKANAGDALSWTAITAAIKNVKVEEATETTEEALQRVLDLAESATGENIQQRLEMLLNAMSEKLRHLKAEVADREGTNRTFTRQSDLEAPVRNAKAKVAAARCELDELKTAEKDARNALETVKKQREVLAELLGAASPEDDSAARSALSEQIDAARLVLELMGDPARELTLLDADMQPSVAAVRDCDARIGQLNELIADGALDLKSSEGSLAVLDADEARRQISALEKEDAGLRATASGYIADRKRIQEEIIALSSRRKKVVAATACPTCGADGDGWRSEMLDEMDAQLSALDANIVDAIAKGEQARLRHLKIVDETRAPRELLARAAELSEEIKAVQDRQTSFKSDLAAVVASRQTAINKQQDSVNKLLRDRETMQAASQKKQEGEALRLAQIGELEKALFSADDEMLLAKQAAAAELVVEAETALAAADKKKADADAERGRLITLGESNERKLVAITEKEILTQAKIALETIQKDAINNSFEPLLQTVRMFTDGILKAPLAIHDSELGYWQDGQFVTHRTFSGTEEALSYLGLMVALAAADDAPLKVAMLDEMGRFDRQVVRPAVMERMIEMTQKGVIGNFIGIDPDREFYEQYADRDGVLIYEVGK